MHIEVINLGHQLHAGQFVETLIEGKSTERGIAVPLAAVLRSADGDWQVFVETAPGRFEPREVEVVRTAGDQMVIEGIAEGVTLVTKGPSSSSPKSPRAVLKYTTINATGDESC